MESTNKVLVHKKKKKEFDMSFRDFLADKYPEVTGKIANGEVISCPNLEDFLAYIANTNIIDISAVDFSKDQPITIEGRVLVSLIAENADYEGGVTLKSVTVTGDISFHGSEVRKVFCLRKIKCSALIFPEKIEKKSEISLFDISVSKDVTLSAT